MKLQLSRDISREARALDEAIRAVDSLARLLNFDEMTRCSQHSASKYNGRPLDVNEVSREEYRYGRLDAEIDRAKDAMERLQIFLDVHLSDETDRGQACPQITTDHDGKMHYDDSMDHPAVTR